MRVSVVLTVLVLGALAVPAFAEEKARGPYDRVATGRPPVKGETKVYTNSDLARLFGIAVEEDREEPAAETAPATPETDPLIWLQQRQASRQGHLEAVADAEATLMAARKKLAELESQLLATRNPFSARPVLSDEEKKIRRQGGETAAERNERTQDLVQEAREAVSAAEADLARKRAERP